MAGSKHLVDAELAPALAFFPEWTFSADTLPAIRAGFVEQFAAVGEPESPPYSVEERQVPGPAGAPDVRVLVIRPLDLKTPAPALLHIHGGGYVIGSVEMAKLPQGLMAAEVGCVVVSVDYRLAPETPHPGPVEDCYAALKWLHANAAALGVDPARIAVGGESAGGGLAANLAWLARDRGEVPLVFQHLIYPMLDDRTCTAADPHPFTGEFVWTPASNHYGWSSLLGHPPGETSVTPYVAAARSADLSGLPPTFISVGALDLFVEENLEYARRLMRAGVPVELHVYPGAFHGFNMNPSARTSQSALRDSREAVRRALMG